MAKTYRVAVIGRTGKGNYGHGLDVVWNSIPNVEVVAVADADEKGRAACAARIKAKNVYADYRQMLDKEKPQIVSVADRFLDQHRDMVIACAQAGANIFMEKPLCPTLAEADEMVAACERHHVKAAIAHQTRYSPRLKVVRELIAAGKLGDVMELRGRGKEDARAGGQDLMILGTHIMDLMRFLVGDPRWCYARVSLDGKLAAKADVKDGAEGAGPIAGNHIIAQYGFDKGTTGYFGTQKSAPGNARFGLQIYGSKGVIALTTGSLPAAFYCEDPAWFVGKGKAPWQEISSNGLGQPETLKDGGLGQGNVWIVQDLIEAIEKDRPPLGSIHDGRAALEMILAVYEAHRVKGPVELPLKNRKHPLAML